MHSFCLPFCAFVLEHSLTKMHFLRFSSPFMSNLSCSCNELKYFGTSNCERKEMRSIVAGWVTSNVEVRGSKRGRFLTPVKHVQAILFYIILPPPVVREQFIRC